MKNYMRIFRENQPGRGEDASTAGEHYGFVFDGLGGTGGRILRNARGEASSESKLASNTSAAAVSEVIEGRWADWNESLDFSSEEAVAAMGRHIAKELKHGIDAALARTRKLWQAPDSRSVMPTTMAGWLTFPAPGGRLLAMMIWLGDSRCYVFDGKHMRQTSRDDANILAGKDQMTEILSGDSPGMSSTICVDRPYELNVRCIVLEETAVLFACTDGLYNSMQSPMHLEYCLRTAACNAESLEQMRTEFETFIESSVLISDDSYSVVMLAYAPESGEYPEIAAMMQRPLDRMETQFIDAFPQKPERPDYDADDYIRRLANKLIQVKAFHDGLQSHILDLAEQEQRPGEIAQDIIGAVRMRRDQECRRNDEDICFAEQSLADVEARLREVIAGLEVVTERVRVVGTDRHSDNYRNNSPKMDLVQRIDWMLKQIANSFKYETEYIGLNKQLRLAIPPRRIRELDDALHDMVVFVNQNELMMREGYRLSSVFTSMSYPVLDKRALTEEESGLLYRTIRDNKPLRDDMIPGLQLSLSQVERLWRLNEERLEWEEKIHELREKVFVLRLTEEEKLLCRDRYAVRYARAYLNTWYKTHQAPQWVKLSDAQTEYFVKYLGNIWDLDNEVKQYNARYEQYQEEVMALWRAYLLGYNGWEAGPIFPQSLILEMKEKAAEAEKLAAAEEDDALDLLQQTQTDGTDTLEEAQTDGADTLGEAQADGADTLAEAQADGADTLAEAQADYWDVQWEDQSLAQEEPVLEQAMEPNADETEGEAKRFI